MAVAGTKPAILICALIIVFGIIHFGSGIGIVARYRKYQDVFRPSIGLGAFDIIIGMYAVGVGALCLVAAIQQRPALSKTGAICAAVLGILAIASLITALVINSQAVGYIRGRLTYRVTTYSQTQSSIGVIDQLQTNYQCCGVNTWLDWQSVGLGISTGIGTNTGTGTSTGTVTGTNTGTVSGGRRRRDLDSLPSPLVEAVRKRRQTVSGNNIYGLPSGYGFYLPLSCCINGGTGGINAIGGYCAFSAGNGTNGFYVQGCIVAVANVMVLQITGLTILNVCLVILAVVLVPVLIYMFPAAFDPTNPANKQPLSDPRQQEQQQQQPQQYANGGAYGNYYDPNSAPPVVYYSYPEPTYVTYQ